MVGGTEREQGSLAHITQAGPGPVEPAPSAERSANWKQLFGFGDSASAEVTAVFLRDPGPRPSSGQGAAGPLGGLLPSLRSLAAAPRTRKVSGL